MNELMTDLTNDSITVILPCAGEGRRLGLNSPKELFEIFPDTRLIDFSLRHIRDYADHIQTPNHLSVAVVIRPWKTDVTEYVISQLPGISVKPVMFDDRYTEWPGSVFSAHPLFSTYNIVLLPDSFLEVTGDEILLTSMITALKHHRVVFGCQDCTDEDKLRSLGAMRVENGQVTVFQDKPRHSLDQFNGFWGCYGFQKEYGQILYNFLIDSVHHQPQELTRQPFFPPAAIPISCYYDLGTWDNIQRFKALAFGDQKTF
ncbi:MAG: hypothetical protein ACM3SY_17525 [Candidatus Omnitrophota bacterium]